MKIIKTLIVDDDPIFCRFLKEFLSDKPGLEVMGEAPDGKIALEKVEKIKPDLVLMDIRMPGIDGFTALYMLKRKSPQVRIIILTIFDDPIYVDSAIENGAAGYVVKSDLVKDLMPAIRAAFKIENRAPIFKGKS
jgi:DNA-binding NarL/FixJ family response regulator